MKYIKDYNIFESVKPFLQESNFSPIVKLKDFGEVFYGHKDSDLIGRFRYEISVDDIRVHDKKFKSNGKLVCIFNFGVEGEFRGRGMGTIMMSKFLDICKNNEVVEAFLWTSHDNEKAISMYKKIGFEDIDSDRYNLYMRKKL